MNNNKKKVGNLTIYDNGINGMSWERRYLDDVLRRECTDYNKISSDDMLDYTIEELLPYNFDKIFTKEEQEFFISEYQRIKKNAKHKDYYDAYDNTWKNYE